VANVNIDGLSPGTELIGNEAFEMQQPGGFSGPGSGGANVYTTAFQIAGAFRSSSDQQAFETACTTFGVTFNGGSFTTGFVFNPITDDTVALQNAILTFAADGLYHKLTMPSCKSIWLNTVFGLTGTVNGAAAGTAPGWGTNYYYASNVTSTVTHGPQLYIPGNISIDWNGCMVVSGPNGLAATCDCQVLYCPNPNVNQFSTDGQSYGMSVVAHSRGTFTNASAAGNVASNGAFNMGCHVVDGSGVVVSNGGGSRLSWEHCYWWFAGKNYFVCNNNAYVLKWYACEFWDMPNGNATTQGGAGCVMNGQNTGAANNENNSFYGCYFFGGGVGIITYGCEVNCFGCSFDYLQAAIICQSFSGTAPSNSYNHKISTHGCHFETFYASTHYLTGNAYYVDLQNSQSMLYVDFGSFWYTQSQLGTTGQVMLAMVNPGTGGATAPYGVTLYSPGYLTLGAPQSLNTAGGTNITVTASASAGVMTITNASASGTIGVGGQLDAGNTLNLVPPGTKISSLGSGTGGNGTYNLSNSITFAATNMQIYNVIPLANASATSRYNYYP
jgi:hypothetical protein